MAFLRNRQRFEVLGRHNNWYKINYRATVGWVYKTYVRLLGSSPDLPIPDTSSSQPSNNPQQPPLPAANNPSIHPSSHSSVDNSNLSNNVITRGKHVEFEEYLSLLSEAVTLIPVMVAVGDHMLIVAQPRCKSSCLSRSQKSRDWIAMTHPRTGRRIQSSSHRGQIYAKGGGAAYAPMVNLAKRLGFKGSKQVWTNNLIRLKV